MICKLWISLSCFAGSLLALNFLLIFEGKLDQNMMAAYFNYSWRNTKGEKVSAKFLDLFIFQNNTTDYMGTNL